MFFVASKLVWMVAAPVTVLFGMAVFGAALQAAGWPRLGRTLSGAGLALLAIAGVVPVGSLLLQPLENRFPPLPRDIPPPTGIVVLGGSTSQALTLARGRVTIAGAAERLTEAVTLSRRYPHARLLFTGGSAALLGSEDSEAADARRLWTELGVDPDRIEAEARSRNTDENVHNARPLADPKAGDSWVLVTSAAHMARAVALFRANAWSVLPDPIDYQTRGTWLDLRPTGDVVGNWRRLDAAAREWIGLIVYRATGRTRDLLPAP